MTASRKLLEFMGLILRYVRIYGRHRKLAEQEPVDANKSIKTQQEISTMFGSSLPNQEAEEVEDELEELEKEVLPSPRLPLPHLTFLSFFSLCRLPSPSLPPSFPSCTRQEQHPVRAEADDKVKISTAKLAQVPAAPWKKPPLPPTTTEALPDVPVEPPHSATPAQRMKEDEDQEVGRRGREGEALPS